MEAWEKYVRGKKAREVGGGGGGEGGGEVVRRKKEAY